MRTGTAGTRTPPLQRTSTLVGLAFRTGCYTTRRTGESTAALHPTVTPGQTAGATAFDQRSNGGTGLHDLEPQIEMALCRNIAAPTDAMPTRLLVPA